MTEGEEYRSLSSCRKQKREVEEYPFEAASRGSRRMLLKELLIRVEGLQTNH